MNYNNRTFRPILNSENGETTINTVFEYKQEGTIVTSEYRGGEIEKGHLIGLVDENGNIEMCYHQVNTNGELMTGTCFSKPEIQENGKYDCTKLGNGQQGINLGEIQFWKKFKNSSFFW